jgi:hypothetical protein
LVDGLIELQSRKIVLAERMARVGARVFRDNSKKKVRSAVTLDVINPVPLAALL